MGLKCREIDRFGREKLSFQKGKIPRNQSIWKKNDQKYCEIDRFGGRKNGKKYREINRLGGGGMITNTAKSVDFFGE